MAYLNKEARFVCDILNDLFKSYVQLIIPIHYYIINKCFINHIKLFTSFCNYCQVPLGLNAEGLPVGIQVVAAPRCDALALAVARHLEDQFGGYEPPCKVLH